MRYHISVLSPFISIDQFVEPVGLVFLVFTIKFAVQNTFKIIIKFTVVEPELGSTWLALDNCYLQTCFDKRSFIIKH